MNCSTMVGQVEELKDRIWVLYRPTVVSKVVTLPVKEKTGKEKKRKTTDVARRLRTRDDFKQILAVLLMCRSVYFVV